MTDRVRRCTECGKAQQLERRTTPYPQSGLNNVQLQNVPVWVCPEGHEEFEIPAVTQLHELLAHSIIRKPSLLNGAEIKFLRRRIDCSAKDFADKLGIKPVHLSRLENDARPLPRRVDLLIRLVVAAYLAKKRGKSFPDDMVRLIEQLEKTWDIGTHRLKHVDSVTPDREWEEASL